MKKLLKYMTNIEGQLRLPRTSPLFKIYSERLLAYLTDRYMASISFIDLLRVRRELRVVQSIRYKNNQIQISASCWSSSRFSSKGNGIYFQETSAYQQLRTIPFNY